MSVCQCEQRKIILLRGMIIILAVVMMDIGESLQDGIFNFMVLIIQQFILVQMDILHLAGVLLHILY